MRHRSVAAVHLGRARVHGHTQGRPQECVLQQSLRSMSVAPPATGAGRVEWIGTLSTIFLHQKEMSDKKHYVNYIHLHRQPVPMARGHLCLLELALLEEAKRVRLAPGARAALSQDSRWTGNNPMSLDLFDAAVDLSGTRDPFDRLIVAHAPL